MACETCPNLLRDEGESGTIYPGQARVMLTRGGGLMCAYITADAMRGGTIKIGPGLLAVNHPDLVAGLENCPRPLTAAEARQLGNPALDGACRPLTERVGDTTDPDAVVVAFSQRGQS